MTAKRVRLGPAAPILQVIGETEDKYIVQASLFGRYWAIRKDAVEVVE
jgi:hypothetical protein